MIEVVQAGQAGKTHLLFDMHRLRKRVFSDRMAWPVHTTPEGLEIDQFDIPDAVYMLALSDERRVIGTWRLLPTTGPTMIRDLWPEFLPTIDMPRDSLVWEASRFAVDNTLRDIGEGLSQINRATVELFCGLVELCLLSGIQQIFTLYDMRIGRLLQRLDCAPTHLSERKRIDQHWVQVGAFRTDESMLQRIQAASGMYTRLVDSSDLPPIFQVKLNHNEQRKKEYVDGHY